MSAKLPEFKDEQYPPDLELKLLQVVHRHGERSPVRRRLEGIIPPVWNLCAANKAMFSTIAQFDKDEIKDLEAVKTKRLVETAETESKSSMPIQSDLCYYGQLTNLGRYRMTILGQRMREFYIDKLHFLPDLYDEKAVYLRSSDYIRTQESVQQLITGGLYPHGKRPDNVTLKLRVRDPRDDLMFPNPNCQRLRALAKEFNQKVSDMLQDRFKVLSKRFKNYVDEVSLKSHPSANGILDTLIAAKAHGFKIPADIDDEELLRDLEDTVVKEWFYGNMVSEEVRRLSLGRLMGVIRDRMIYRATQSKEDDENLKLAVYSGHDTTVAPLLIILNGFDERWPPFGSAVLFELFKQKGTNDHFVRVRYNEKTLELPGCLAKGNHKDGDKSLCTLEAFKNIVKNQIPENWEKECSN
ncbi:histidine phosphatase superfamily [Mycotypha africana]|uniref:histidine phosphatase superfamily n=1 Tax=Mycotypha africana TaxID=64632 RepID=UPI00230010CD|nr:histidine phosphatase superfamily [Mycotypha africana]KAI8967087.1 histidine phosphatase superfamily [Mycotypha africana]